MIARIIDVSVTQVAAVMVPIVTFSAGSTKTSVTTSLPVVAPWNLAGLEWPKAKIYLDLP